jgi:hypothetical protein
VVKLPHYPLGDVGENATLPFGEVILPHHPVVIKKAHVSIFFFFQLLTWHFDTLVKFTNVLNCDTLVNGNVSQFNTLVNFQF